MAPTKHAKWSPSASSAWTKCPDYINVVAAYPPRPSSPAADEGTAAHLIRETALRHWVDARDLIGIKVRVNGVEWPITAEMADFLQPGIDFIREFDGDQFIETRFDLSRVLGDDQFGTCDALTVKVHKRYAVVVISDLKYGFIPVDPYENSQQRIYLIGAWDNVIKDIIPRRLWRETYFQVHIDQPRNKAGGGTWGELPNGIDDVDPQMAITVDHLERWRRYFQAKVEATKAKNPPRHAGEHCKFCPAKLAMECHEYDRWHMEQLMISEPALDDSRDNDLPLEFEDLERLSLERRETLALNTPTIIAWLKANERYVFHQALDDNTTLTKTILGRNGDRKYIDEEKAKKWLLLNGLSRDQLFTSKLISPAQSELLLPRKMKIPSDLVTQKPAAPKLVPMSHKGAKYTGPAIEFEDLEELEFDD